jgi:DNA-binding transcriptional MerR regulator
MATRTPDDRRLSADELAALVGASRRTVRYYVQEGLLDPPIGETRAAYYTEKHLEQLQTIKTLTSEGLSLERIRQRLHGGTDAERSPVGVQVGSVALCSHLTLAPGVELVINAEVARLSPEDVRRLTHVVMTECKRMQKEKSDEN